MSTLVYAPPNQEKTAPDYATIAELKERLGIDSAEFDDRLTLALIAAEIKIEEHLGRAFPDIGVAQIYTVMKTAAVGTIQPGEVIEQSVTALEISKSNYYGTQITVTLEDVTQIIIGTAPYIFDVDSFVEESASWVFTGTIDSGSFPSPVGGLVQVNVPALQPPEGVLTTVPETVHQKAINLGMLHFKQGDSPTGMSGSDAFIGELDVAEAMRSELNDRTLLGLKVSWGAA